MSCTRPPCSATNERMAHESDAKAKVNHVHAAKNAAVRARNMLSPVLRQLQEAALANQDIKVQARLLRAAEQIAGIRRSALRD